MQVEMESEEQPSSSAEKRSKWFYKIVQYARSCEENRRGSRSEYQLNLALLSEFVNTHDPVSFEESPSP